MSDSEGSYGSHQHLRQLLLVQQLRHRHLCLLLQVKQLHLLWRHLHRHLPRRLHRRPWLAGL